MIVSILVLGLVVGMQHAFEADHLAAVSALANRSQSAPQMARRGALWGVGHTLALLIISGGVLVLGWQLPASFDLLVESLVGLLLVGLGARVLYRLQRDRVHVHAHEHLGVNGDAVVHLHAHSHGREALPHAHSPHLHAHPEAGWPTLLVGLAHGAAGSAALVVFAAASLGAPLFGMLYVGLFGVGSILGMAMLSAVIALPLTASARRATWAHAALQATIGLVTIFIGARLLWLQLSHAAVG